MLDRARCGKEENGGKMAKLKIHQFAIPPTNYYCNILLCYGLMEHCVVNFDCEKESE